jgi:parvulin-like peptidyl-prolyl isomerase
MTERLFKDLVITEDEIAKYYEANKSQFRQYESVIVKHILFVDEPTAKRWRGALTTQNFEEMARLHSITPEGKNGGRLGPFMKGMLPAVFDIAFHMKVGEISDILRSNYGYHVILVEEKNPKRKLDLTGARPEIVKILLKKKREMIYDRWLEHALASVKVAAPKAHM